MSEKEDEARYVRTYLLLQNVCPFILRKVIDNFAQQKRVKTYVLLNNHKHDLFHLLYQKCCCGHRCKETFMHKSQWNLLFDKNSSPGCLGHKVICPCQYDINQNITVQHMDVTLCCLIIQNICKGINMAHIETIRDVRNKLAHATNAYLDYPTYDDYWNRVKPALIDLGSNVSIKVKEEAREKVDNLAKQDMSTKELEEVKKSIDEVKKEFSEKVTELKETFTENVTKVEENLSLASEKVTQIEENLSLTSEKVTQVEGNMSLTSEKVTQIEENMSQVQIEVGQMQSQIDALSESQMQNQAVEEDTERKLTDLDQEASKIKQWLLKRNIQTTKLIPITPLLHRSLKKELPIEQLYAQVVIREDLSYVQSTREVTDPYDIITQDGGVTYLLGDAAYGKTTNCIWLLKKWCDSHQDDGSGSEKENDKWDEAMKEIDFVFLLRLRNVSPKHVYIIDMICEDIFKRSNIDKEILRRLFTSEKYKSLILIDGLDEWNPNEEIRLLHKTPDTMHMSYNVSILFTMRTWLFPTIMVESCDNVVEIHGLSEDGIGEVIKNVLVNYYKLETEEEYTEAHKAIIKEMRNESLKSFMRIPLLAVVCVQIWHEKKMIGKGLSSLFAALINMLILRAIEKHGLKIEHDDRVDSRLPKLLSENENIKNNITLISKLGKVAYHQLLRNKTSIVLENKTIEKEIGVDTNELQFLLHIGLISKKEEPCAIGKNIHLNFFHKIVQEFLAVIFMTHEDSVDSLSEHLSNVKEILGLSNVIMFVCGISPHLGATLSKQAVSVIDKDEQIKRYRLTASMQGNETINKLYKLQLIWYREFKFGQEMSATTETFHVSDIYLSINSDSETVEATRELLSSSNFKIRSLHLDNVPSTGESSISDTVLNAFLAKTERSGSLVKLCISYRKYTVRSLDMINGPSLKTLYLANIQVPHVSPNGELCPPLLTEMPMLQNIVLSNVTLGLRRLGFNASNECIEKAMLMRANFSEGQWEEFVKSLSNLRRTFEVELFNTNIDAKSLNFVCSSPSFNVLRKDLGTGKFGNFVNFTRVWETSDIFE